MPTFLKKHQYTLIVIGVAIVAFLFGLYGQDLLGTGSGLGGAAGASINQEMCDASSLLGEDPAGIVLADPLNMRVGPGLDYHIVSLLNYCTPVQLVGRSSDATWLQIQLPGSLEGWVYSYYIKANIDLGDLEVTTGFGGPDTAASGTTGQRNVSVIIQANQAAAFVTGMPANSDVMATLNPSEDSANGVWVASGQTDAQGNTVLTFTMPETWADGSPLESGTMTLTVVAGDAEMTIWLTYYTQ